MLVLRKRDPHRPRVFRAPLAWVIGPVAILGCAYLFSSLPTKTQLWCVVWNAFGLLVYLAYARRNSVLAKGVNA
jgi:APA family basic amino acid/polyamine antiporter